MLVMLVMGATVGSLVLVVSSLLGPKFKNPRKNMPFECGVPGQDNSHRRFSVHFYLVAILFLLFDVEAIFFFPFAVVFKKYLAINTAIIITMGFFVGILLIGYFYVLKKGALEWE